MKINLFNLARLMQRLDRQMENLRPGNATLEAALAVRQERDKVEDALERLRVVWSMAQVACETDLPDELANLVGLAVPEAEA
jgi:hypothetical protein